MREAFLKTFGECISKANHRTLHSKRTTDSHFTENHQMDSKLGLRFISKIDQQQEYLKASSVESVEQTKLGGF